MASRLPELLAFTRYRLCRGAFLLFVLISLWFAFSHPRLKDSLKTLNIISEPDESNQPLIRLPPKLTYASSSLQLEAVPGSSNSQIHTVTGYRSQEPDESNSPQQSVEQPKLHPDVNIVPPVPLTEKDLPHIRCVPLPSFPVPGKKICIHPNEMDDLIGPKFLMANRLWEADLVFQMQNVLNTDPSIVLLDIGSNIGVYSVWAAALGHRVVAVDMMPANLQVLQKSIYLNGVADNVTLVNNGVYFDHRTLETTRTKQCPSIACAKLNADSGGKSTDKIQVRTICLNDLVPLLENQNVYIKMDIENTEHHALACADELFKRVNIKVVQMEWHRKIPKESVPIINFMQAHGYVSSLTSVEYKPVNLVNLKKRLDVFFLKKST